MADRDRMGEEMSPGVRVAWPANAAELRLAPLGAGDLALAGDVRHVGFPRPGWHVFLTAYAAASVLLFAVAAALAGGAAGAAVLAASLWLSVLAGRVTLERMRASWDDDAVVIASWPRRLGRRLARAEVAEVCRRRDALVVRTRDGGELPLVVVRAVTDHDAASARRLADGLGVPYVDDTGEVLPLPEARLRPKG